MPLSKTGVELLFKVFSRRYERSASLVTSNLPFNEWIEAFGSERLTGALLDRSPTTSTSWNLTAPCGAEATVEAPSLTRHARLIQDRLTNAVSAPVKTRHPQGRRESEMKTMMRRVMRLENRLPGTGLPIPIWISRSPLQEAGLLPKSGLIVLPDDLPAEDSWAGGARQPVA